MLIRIRLSDADRERLGCPEQIEVDPTHISYDEQIVLQKGVDIEGAVCSFDSAAEWRAALGKGEPFAEKVLIWVALRRAGLKLPLGGFDADRDGMDWDIERDPTDPGEPGKGTSTPETTSS
jgi:hypothetical protein